MSASTDRRSDIFSVGVMAAEAITGRVPARAPNGGISPSVLNNLLEAQRPEARADLRKVLLWCMTDKLDERCPSAEEMHAGVSSNPLHPSSTPATHTPIPSTFTAELSDTYEQVSHYPFPGSFVAPANPRWRD